MTYSVVIVQGRKIGIGVVSGSIAVGNRVPYIRYPYCGVVSQGYTNPALGPIIANLIERGYKARRALEEALKFDVNPGARQVAVLTMDLDKAVHVGSKTPLNRGAFVGEDFVVVANLVKDRVIESMATAAESEGGLVTRLYKSLAAGHTVGGDLRGDKSAAILVHGETRFSPYYNTVLDLRVDYSNDPLRDLEKLLEVYEAYL